VLVDIGGPSSARPLRGLRASGAPGPGSVPRSSDGSGRSHGRAIHVCHPSPYNRSRGGSTGGTPPGGSTEPGGSTGSEERRLPPEAARTVAHRTRRRTREDRSRRRSRRVRGWGRQASRRPATRERVRSSSSSRTSWLGNTKAAGRLRLGITGDDFSPKPLETLEKRQEAAGADADVERRCTCYAPFLHAAQQVISGRVGRHAERRDQSHLAAPRLRADALGVCGGVREVAGRELPRDPTVAVAGGATHRGP